MVNSLYSRGRNSHRNNFLRAQACKILGLFGNFETVNPAGVAELVVILDPFAVHDFTRSWADRQYAALGIQLYHWFRHRAPRGQNP